MNNKNKELYYLTELVSAVLNNRKPAEKPADISFENVYKQAKFHRIANMCYYAVTGLENKPDGELLKKWKYDRDEAIAKDMIQRMEYDSIVNAMTKAKVRILPVKGIVLKDLYPKSDMRYMSDLDMLIDENASKPAEAVMESIGYYCDRSEQGHHDTYFKRPYMNVELHRELMSVEAGKYYEYYKNGWERAVESGPYFYEYNINDNFIYIMAHAAKHFYVLGGTGIRTVIDIYLFIKKNKDKLDMDYIHGEFRKLGCDTLFINILNIGKKWFENADIPIDESTEETLLTSGIYGTFDRRISNSIEDIGSKHYILKRLFPPLSRLSGWYPILKKAPFLLPFVWIWRLITSVIFKRDRIKNELDVYKKHEDGKQ